MNKADRNQYDVIVIGAGHAGCEAALAAARLGKNTLLLTISLEQIAHMPCNPSIGGTGKGQLVKEIDALGGEMGLLIDKTFIQMRMLNRSKGPAVWSPRAQADKARYHAEMKKTLEQQKHLHLRQGEVESLLFDDIEQSATHAKQLDETGQPAAPNGRRRVRGVSLRSGMQYEAAAVILATGTYLGSRVFVSDRSWSSGPSGFAPAALLAQTLSEEGIRLIRKSGLISPGINERGTPILCDANGKPSALMFALNRSTGFVLKSALPSTATCRSRLPPDSVRPSVRVTGFPVKSGSELMSFRANAQFHDSRVKSEASVPR